MCFISFLYLTFTHSIFLLGGKCAYTVCRAGFKANPHSTINVATMQINFTTPSKFPLELSAHRIPNTRHAPVRYTQPNTTRDCANKIPDSPIQHHLDIELHCYQNPWNRTRQKHHAKNSDNDKHVTHYSVLIFINNYNLYIVLYQ